MCDVPAVQHGRRSARLPRLRKRSEFLAAARGKRFHTERMSVQWVDRARGKSLARPIPDAAAHEHDVVNAPGFGCLSQADVALSGATRLESGPRFGLTVTKKTGNAVERNRIRRRLREVLRQLRPEWPEAALDVVVVARRGALSASFDALAVDLKRAIATFSSTRKRAERPSAHRPANTTDRP
ncbi:MULTISPECIES: ribonuclease P protein component [unclassified Chelatococcus]|uniref:ribonuclease P protein component n=1 Tax=unclassified Chelatococcus TaxID=2638111 RepID=UPI001BCFB7BF|nr:MULTISPECIES: ribonuclease P protein component [unclassified Chelatococcus]MBS7697551.1 ribonuclease P protein component [Chelatococcus sp. YT9]MBX3559374.1 ribonuclease P protein component [Chelatococcus sp.]